MGQEAGETGAGQEDAALLCEVRSCWACPSGARCMVGEGSRDEAVELWGQVVFRGSVGSNLVEPQKDAHFDPKQGRLLVKVE